jgi:glyoxylase-like metal-dependent hydrolase (beta-lactamase superfamily II)
MPELPILLSARVLDRFGESLARAAREVCSGEIIQTQHRFDLHLATEDYLRIVKMKTGSLFSAAAELGAPADERNRITLAMRPLVVRGARTMIIDAGLGDKESDEFLDTYGADRRYNLHHALADAGLAPEDIDIVLASHLHFDHAGGFTVRDAAGRLRPRFPRAQYIVRRGEWEDATHPHSQNTARYRADNYVPLAEAALVGHFLGLGFGLSMLFLGPASGYLALRFDERLSLRRDALRFRQAHVPNAGMSRKRAARVRWILPGSMSFHSARCTISLVSWSRMVSVPSNVPLRKILMPAARLELVVLSQSDLRAFLQWMDLRFDHVSVF